MVESSPMTIKPVVVKGWECTCERCGHRWFAKAKPVRCASCKSPNWNRAPVYKPRKAKAEK